MSAIHIYRIEGRHKDLVLVRNAYSRYETDLFPASGLWGWLRLRWVLEVRMPF